MPNYHSKSLNRDFDLVYFTAAVTVNGASPGADGKSVELPKNHPPIAGAAPKLKVDLSGIKKAPATHRRPLYQAIERTDTRRWPIT